MGWAEDLLLGAVARGVNKRTLAVLNLSLGACALLVAALLLAERTPPELAPHLAALLALALGLVASVNWVVAQTGTVSAAEQRREVFGAARPPVKRE